MTVVQARVMGMCFGVRRAVGIARSVSSPEEVTIYGRLVHNEQVMAKLVRRGFHVVDKPDRGPVPTTPGVLIPAHGISCREASRLSSAGKRLIDATCPFVKEIHEIARAFARDGRFVIVVGQPGHVEVEGIVGELADYAVVPEPTGAALYPSERLGVVCQSTIAAARAQQVLRAVRAHNPDADIEFARTICTATRDRQVALSMLLGRVDAVVVVGGQDSNNTRELVQLARCRGLPCFHIQRADDLVPEQFRGCETVGLTAGASTPDAEIEAVEEALTAISAGVPAAKPAEELVVEAAV